MTATIAPPFTCPHGAHQARSEAAVLTIYSDGCRTLSGSGLPRMFWCGAGEMSKPNGVVIYEGEYLRDWDEALVLNAGDELYDEAESENWWRDRFAESAALAEEHAAFLADHANHWQTVPECAACENGGYLGEVPWTDRVED